MKKTSDSMGPPGASRSLSVWRLAWQELWHRKFNCLLSLLFILTTVALFVLYFTTAKASDRETKRVARDMGFNLRIIPRETNMERFWGQGFSDLTLPEDAVDRLAQSENVFFSYNHLVASLQQRYSVEGGEVVLTGVAPAITAPAQRNRPMGYSIKPGTLHLGFQVARRLGLREGDTLSLGTEAFRVERCLVESGTDDDIRVFGSLSDVQRVLGLNGRINEIKAIDCLCLTADEDPLQFLRDYMEKALPEARVIQLRTLADARARQRRMVREYYAFLTSVLLVASALWIGLLAVLNVRERRQEIGILRALGYGSSRIAALFLAKAIWIGLIGALGGYVLGSLLAVWLGPHIFPVTAKAIRAEPFLLAGALAAAPLFAALASLVPTLLAVTQDPAEALREE